MLAGKIISVSDLLVEVLLSGVQVKKRDMMYAVKGEKTYRFEVEDSARNDRCQRIDALDRDQGA